MVTCEERREKLLLTRAALMIYDVAALDYRTRGRYGRKR